MFCVFELEESVCRNHYQTLSHQHLSSWLNVNKVIKFDLAISLTDIMQENTHLNVARLEHKSKIEELEKANAKLLEKIQGTCT